MGDIQKLMDGEIWEEPVNVELQRCWINFEGIQVPVMSLEYEYQAYQRMGRIEKANKTWKWLEGHRG
jgi:hypothetical protein